MAGQRGGGAGRGSGLGAVRRRRGTAVGGTLAVLATVLALVPGSAGTAAAATKTSGGQSSAAKPVDYREFEQQVAQAINSARTDPTKMADELQLLQGTHDGYYASKLPDGSAVSTELAWLKAATDEARSQPALPALAWSEKLAQLGRDHVPTQNRGGRYNLFHGDYGARTKAAGLNALSIEAITNADLNPNSVVYAFWISSHEWTIGSPFNPTGDPALPSVTNRGHRGIVNDNRMTAIGVGCGPFMDNGKARVVCVLNDGVDLSDESTVTPSAGGTPKLADLPASISATIGSTTLPGQSTLTVDPFAATSVSTSAPTQTVGPSLAKAGGGTDPSVAPVVDDQTKYPDIVGTPDPAEAPTEAPTPSDRVDGDLKFGETFDVNKDGSFLITVIAQDAFTPNESATIYGSPTSSYRGYQVTYDNQSDKVYDLADVAKFTCVTANGTEPFVIQPPGQGLPATQQLGRGQAVFAFGCGSGPTGYARVSAVLGDQLGNSRRGWYEK